MSCWHDSFTTAIATELSLSAGGKVWLQTTLRDPILSIQGEVAWWQSNNLTEFILQWQNYKLPGLIQTIQVENAFGVQYPLTLQSRNGTWRLSDQTSMKMYWSFASDLWACGSNASGIGGSSLIRQSSRFAFSNITIHSVLIANLTLPRVMTWATQLFEQHIGPYGSIDVHYILPPKALVALSTNLTKELQALCYTKPALSTLCQVMTKRNWYQTILPSSWQQASFVYFGGTPLCFAAATSQPTPYPFCDAVGPCTLPAVAEGMIVTDWMAVIAAVSCGNIDDKVIQQICLHVLETRDCQINLARIANMLSNVSTIAAPFQNQLDMVRSLVGQLNVSLFQFAAKRDGSRTIALANVFSQSEPGWTFWSWIHLYLWATSNREVISFTGAHGALAVFSTSVKSEPYVVKSLDIPQSLCLYFLRGVQYVTFIMVCVVAMVVVYFVLAKGRIEPRNVVKINSVGGTVWVGRPLLFLRAVSALCFLSTGQLQLV
ncbi:hypothetical protein Ae201684P_003392 [Aphanomyces euteiches]|nr:hypothetical protein Ae201684P_003392 [Aphanomyces euteiches]